MNQPIRPIIMRSYAFLPILLFSFLLSGSANHPPAAPAETTWSGDSGDITPAKESKVLNQYYFGELKTDPDRNYFNPDEPITIFYTNRGFDSVWIIRSGLEKLRRGEWVSVPPRRVTFSYNPPSPNRPPRLREVRSGESFTYTFPSERLLESGELSGIYRYRLQLTSRPRNPDYAVLYREFVIR